MKIIEIIPELNSGGAERFVVDLCNELSLRNDVVLVVLHSLEKHGFYKDEVSKSVRTISLNKNRGVDIPVIFKIRRIISREHPDIVHTHLAGIDYTFYSILSYRKAKYYHTIHNDAYKESSGGLRLFIRMIAFKSHIVQAITISSTSNNSFFSLYGVAASMIVNGRNIPRDFIPSKSVESEISDYRDKGRVLIQLARFEPQKRHLLMAKVASQLTNKGYSFSLLMIGAQSDSSIINKIKEIGCPNVYLLGTKSNPLDYLSCADAFCLCSLFEGMPISLIEALSVGAVPVCTPVGGIIDTIIDGYNGILSKDLSEEAYLDAVERFLTMSDRELKGMKDHAVDSFKQFRMADCASQYLHLFQNNN